MIAKHLRSEPFEAQGKLKLRLLKGRVSSANCEGVPSRESGVAASGAALVGQSFEDFVCVQNLIGGEREFWFDAAIDFFAHAVADVLVERVAPREIGVNERAFLQGKAIGAERRQSGGGGYRCRLPSGLQIGQSNFTDYQGTGDEITKALVFLGQDGARHADGVERGQPVDNAHKVPGDGFGGSQRAARILDDANAHFAFAGGLAIPENFEESVVAEIKKKEEKEEDCYSPYTGLWRGGGNQADNHKPTDGDDEAHKRLNEDVDGKSEEAAADSSNLKVERRLFRRFNGKLVGK